MIKVFCDTFGEDQVFNNLGIMFTRWGYTQRDIYDRQLNSLTDDMVKKQVRDHLIQEFPSQVDALYTIPMFFSNNFDFNYEILEKNLMNSDEEQKYLAVKDIESYK